jgi:glutaredoxin
MPRRRAEKIVREKRVAEKAQVILYTKPGCHLCDEMKREIQRAGCAELYALDEVNIETDADLLARYRYEIPVLLVDGVEAFRHRLRAEDFKARLTGQQS